MFEINKCVKCGEQRATETKRDDGAIELTNPKWESAFGVFIARDIINDNAARRPAIPFAVLTICPKCREKTTVNDMLRLLIEIRRGEIKESVNNAEKEMKQL
jgi:predicted nucleic-acid-binding Zn-ribbon protein